MTIRVIRSGMRLRRDIVCVACYAAVTAFTVDSAQSAPPALAELAAIHRSLESELGVVHLSEHVTRTETNDPAEASRLQAQLDANLAQALASARQEWDADHANDAAGWARWESQIRAQHGRVAELLSLKRSLNSGVMFRRTRTVDLAGSRVRWDDVDLRDLEQLARDRQLDDRAIANVNLSAISILKDGVHWHGAVADRLARRASIGVQNPDLERVRLGIAPTVVFQPQYEPVLSWPNGEDVAVITTSRGDGMIRAVLDRSNGWRLSRYEVATTSGDRLVWIVEGYTSTQEPRVPDRILHRVRKAGRGDLFEDFLQTIAVQTRLPVEAHTFDLPSDFRVQDGPVQ